MSADGDEEPDCYSFERPNSRRSTDLADGYLAQFTDRLGLDLNLATEGFRSLLEDYVNDHHCAIAWYQTAREGQVSKRNLYRGISIALLIAIPLSVSVFPFAFRLSVDPVVISGLVTGALTSLYGTHRAVTSWIRQQEPIGLFWKAEAGLKSSLYNLERKWRGRVMSEGDVAPEFLEALETGIAEARETIRTEQSAFFETFKIPKIDLDSTISSAASRATSLWRVTAKPAIKSFTEDAVANELEIERLQRELAALRDLQQVSTDQEELKGILKRRREINLELAKLRSAFGA